MCVVKARRSDLPYRIAYSPDALDHLGMLTARQQAIVTIAVQRQLARQPTVETRTLKPMTHSPLAPWELRVGSLCVHYDVEEAPEPVVYVDAIGVKIRN